MFLKKFQLEKYGWCLYQLLKTVKNAKNIDFEFYSFFWTQKFGFFVKNSGIIDRIHTFRGRAEKGLVNIDLLDIVCFLMLLRFSEVFCVRKFGRMGVIFSYFEPN